MVAKCTNPSCSAGFRYLHEGELFRLEVHPLLNSNRSETVEYFWLCSRCSQNMTLRLAQNGTIVATPLRQDQATHEDTQVMLATVNQETRRFLRSVSFLRRNIAVEMHENAA